MNFKIAETEGLLDILSEVFGQPTTEVVIALRRCGIVSWDDLMSSVRKDASELMTALQREES